VTDADAQTHTDEAAARVRAYIDARTRGQDAPITWDDLRAVLDALADAQTQVAGLKTERAGWRSIAGVDEIEAERDVLRAQVVDYENRIAWHTTCKQCATVLDAGIRDHERAEKAEERVAELEAETTERQWGLRWTDGDISICADEENARYRVEHHPQYGRTVVYRDLRRSPWRAADPAPDASGRPDGDAS